MEQEALKKLNEEKEEILADEFLLKKLEEEHANQYVNEDAIIHHGF